MTASCVWQWQIRDLVSLRSSARDCSIDSGRHEAPTVAVWDWVSPSPRESPRPTVGVSGSIRPSAKEAPSSSPYPSRAESLALSVLRCPPTFALSGHLNLHARAELVWCARQDY